MGMIMCLETASDQTVKRLLHKPDLIEEWLGAEDDDAPATDDHIQLDLDKAWHAIHFLLCGSTWEGDGPEAFLLAGGTEIGDIDVGYGPARAFRSDEIKVIHDALSTIPPNVLRTRYDPKVLTEAEIYPEIWNNEEDADYVVDTYDSLIQHLATAVAKRVGMVVYLT